MDPVTMMIVPGFLGGLVVAWAIWAFEHRGGAHASVARPSASEPLSSDVINMARIKVTGVGGLGLVAMAVVVALDFPRIWLTVSAGFVLGLFLAVVMITRRRFASTERKHTLS